MKLFLLSAVVTGLLLLAVRPTIPRNLVGAPCRPCDYLSPNYLAQLRGVLRQRNQTVLTAQEYGSQCCALAGYVDGKTVRVFLNPKLVSQRNFHSVLKEEDKLFVLYKELCFTVDEEQVCVEGDLAATYTIAFSMLEGFNRSLNRVL